MHQNLVISARAVPGTLCALVSADLGIPFAVAQLLLLDEYGRVAAGSDRRSLVLSVFYLPITVPTSSRFLDVQPAKRHRDYPLSLQSASMFPCLGPSLCTICLRNCGSKADGRVEKEMMDELFLTLQPREPFNALSQR